MLGHAGSPTDTGDEENSYGWLCSHASHRESSELGEINTLEGFKSPERGIAPNL